MTPRLTPSDATLALCSPSSPYPTLSSTLSSSPHSSPSSLIPKVLKSLPGERPSLLKRGWERFVSDGGMRVEVLRGQRSEEEKAEERRRVLEASGWEKEGEGRPSDLFLEMFASVLLTTSHTSSPLSQTLYTPRLLPSTGVVPLSIISPIPAILAHYYACIVLARREVLLFTNYWQVSDSSRTIGRALKELSKRVVEDPERRQRGKVVVKLLFDRGTVKQLWRNHSPVEDGEEWDVLGIPRLKEIPGLELQVINYHRPLLGTFHSKMLVIDRTIALLNSNNIQDRPNVEMMLHLEGPIVEPLFETCLYSFWNEFTPPLPTTLDPPPQKMKKDKRKYDFQEKSRWLGYLEISRAAEAVKRILLDSHSGEGGEAGEKPTPRMRDLVRAMIERGAEQPPGPTWRESFALSLGGAGSGDEGEGWFSARASRMGSRRGSGANTPRERSPGVSRRTSLAVPRPHQTTTTTTTLEPTQPIAPLKPSPQLHPQHQQTHRTSFDNAPTRPLPKDERPLVSTSLTDADPEPLTPASPSSASAADDHNPTKETEHPHHPHPHHVRIKEDLLGAAGRRTTARDTERFVMTKEEKESVDAKAGLTRLEKLTALLNAGTLSQPQPTVQDSEEVDEFTPHILHRPHGEVPMVLVNRRPRGMAGHQSLRTPQNAAWLAGFYSAKKRVFIQTPTWNAKPAVAAALDACRRGVEVIIYAGLGFNDKGESIPFQGGTNEEVAVRMYKALRKEGKQGFLKMFWYVGKDQIHPINAVHKQRNCHIKLAIFDDEVGIVGNGNQDTQSWYHSQEVNVMIDSKQICRDWIMALEHNQNTHLYGRLDEYGIWKDPQGRGLDFFDPKKGRLDPQKVAKEKAAEKAAMTNEVSSEGTDTTRV